MPAMRRIAIVLTIMCLSLPLGGCLATGQTVLASLWPEDEPEAVAPAAPMYCYRNLARMDCYTGPDPQRRN